MSVRRISMITAVVVSVGATFGIFQNCSSSQFLGAAQSRMTDESLTALSTCETPDCESIRSGVENCSFNGIDIPHGGAIDAYPNSSVPFGNACISETRVCSNGVLSGSYQFDSCSVGSPVACLFNGASVPHASAVTAFQSSSVFEPATCVSEQRFCVNGALSGSYQFGSCSVSAPRSCIFDGRTIASGSTVIAYQNSSASVGTSCMQEIRTCTDGVLSGTFTHATCSVDQPAACQFNGQTVASGQQVVAFQNSSVAFGQTCVSAPRICTNGALSGSYSHATCAVNAPAACSFNGQTVAHGQAVNAFLNSTEAFGSTCQMESRTCSNGQLSGSHTFASCQVDAPASCSFNGMTIASGATVVAYPVGSVAHGQTCSSETRTCLNGQLSGSAQFGSCTVNTPQACLFNGQTVPHDALIPAYQTSSVAFGSACKVENRKCVDGQLTGSYTYGSCTVNTPQACLFNGRTIPHGSSAVGYQAASVNFPQACVAQTRTCSNGTLGGSYTAPSCVVVTPRWVNVTSRTETHAQACARVGGKVPTDPKGYNGQGICASPESQPGASGGTGYDRIAFPYGIGKYSGRRGGGGQLIVKSSGRGGSRIMCYKPGQKKDGDSTDMLVAYLCLPK